MSTRRSKSVLPSSGTAHAELGSIYGPKPKTPKPPPQKPGSSASRRKSRKATRSTDSSSPSSNQSSRLPSRAPTPPTPASTTFNPRIPSPAQPIRTPSRSPTPQPRNSISSSSSARTPTPPPERPPQKPSRRVLQTLSPRSPDIVQPKQTIQSISIGEILTEVKMTPPWFEQEDQQKPLRNIVYPKDIVDQHPFDSVARYRAIMKKTNNFQKKSIESGPKKAETMIIALDKFAQQFGGDLSFTNQQISCNESIRRAACGVGTLGSVHLLATNHILTARFVFQTNLNYKQDLAKSPETMENFTLSFATAIAQELKCQNEYVRVLSIEENDLDGDAKVDFGITTLDQISTEILADDLSEFARVGFRQNEVLKCVKKGKYECTQMPLLTYLQLRPDDFDPEHNFDYREGDLKNGYRGGYPYNVPRGWYRQALNISNKYDDEEMRWLSHLNTDDVWPLAYHGIHADVASDVAKEGLLHDKVAADEFREEAVERAGLKMDKPGIYLNTHCDGGAHPRHTKTFSVQVSRRKTERFRIVFQCRVKPGEFTFHQSPLITGDIWRVVDPTAVRPYGILIRQIRGKQPDAEY